MPRTFSPEREAQIRDMKYVAASKRCEDLLAELDAERAVSYEALKACRVVKEFLNKLEGGEESDDPLSALRKRFHAKLHDALNAALDKDAGLSL